jgi:indolepyruvate ferredoxin oxidoreductase alpha subunit
VLEAIEVLGLQDTSHIIQVLGVYPIPRKALVKELEGKKMIVVVEDQDGFLEQQIKMELYNELQAEIHGKDWFPAYGELSVGEIIEILASKLDIDYQAKGLKALQVVERLGTFCEGCPHTSSYFAIEQAIPSDRRIIGGDIGCSSLPPFRADWLLCMNAGIGMSLGVRPFLSNQSIVSTGGDGSFFHGGLLTVLNAVQNAMPLLHVVFDNRSVAMTGHQESPSKSVDYRGMIEAMGVDSFTELSAWEPKKIQSVIEEKEALNGVHIVWISGNCARIPDDRSRFRQANLYPEIDAHKCLDCRLCYDELACPAIEENPISGFEIKLDRCMRCGVCHEICPNGAITIHQVKQ